MEFKVQDKMEGSDVYVYYQLKNFYQNHRTYVKSRSDKQLLGTELEGRNGRLPSAQVR